MGMVSYQPETVLRIVWKAPNGQTGKGRRILPEDDWEWDVVFAVARAYSLEVPGREVTVQIGEESYGQEG